MTLLGKTSSKVEIPRIVGDATATNSILDAVANSLAVRCGLSQAIEVLDPIAALIRNIGSTIHHIGNAWAQVAHNLPTCHHCLYPGSACCSKNHPHNAQQRNPSSHGGHDQPLNPCKNQIWKGSVVIMCLGPFLFCVVVLWNAMVVVVI